MKTSIYSVAGVLAFAYTGISAQAWTPGVGSESNTSAFTVNTQSRNDVISFWHCVYQQSEGYEDRITWTGSISSGTPGTTATAFKNDVERRINYYRAMAGLSANIEVNNTSTVVLSGGTPSGAKPSASTTKAAAAQAAALMLSRNTTEFLAGGGVATGAHNPHNPPLSWAQDTSTARNGAYHSNLALGKFGPGAIDAYMSEDDQAAGGGLNDDVGHRRFFFYSRIQQVATGDVTSTPHSPNDYFSANAVYVSGNLLPVTTTPEFVAWPNVGFVPEPIVPERWSLSYPEADFSSAVVSMTDAAGAPISTTVVSVSATFGDATIVWTPNAASILSADSSDQTYNVTVSNIIIDGSPVSHSYTTTIINPDRLLESSDLIGSASPPSTGADYFFEHIPHAESYGYRISALVPSTWVEGAENSSFLTNETELSDGQMRSTNSKWMGNRSIRMAFETNTETHAAVVLDRTFIPNTDSKVEFYTQRGVMLSSTTWALQIKNGNDPWVDLKTLTNHTGSGLYPLDSEFVFNSINIPAIHHGSSASLRIVYRKGAGTSFEVGQHSLVGVFTDEISLVNCDDFSDLGSYTYTPASLEKVSLNSITAGESLVVGKKYLLSFSVKVGCKDFGFGTALEVIPVSSGSLTDYENWLRSSYSVIGDFDEDYDNDGIGNGLEYIFDLDPLDSTDGTAALAPSISGGNFQLSHPIRAGETVAAEYSHTLGSGSWLPATVTISGGTATATTPLTDGKCFLRWKVASP